MSADNADKNLLPLAEAAGLMGTTKVHLLMMVKRGLIPAVERDGEWFVDPGETLEKPDPAQVFKHKQCQKSSGCGGCH